MKIIIYLASHDPAARTNMKSLHGALEDTLIEPHPEDVILRHIHANDQGELVRSKPSLPNIFDTIPVNQRNNIIIDFITHGDGSRRLKSIPFNAWDDSSNAVNVYNDIQPAALKKFLDDNAYDNNSQQYKFSELVIYACSGYDFSKELALSMPDIKITCFKEYIKIDPLNGKAYPYAVVKEENKPTEILPADIHGQPIYNKKEIATEHHPAPLRILKGTSENTLYASADADPANHPRSNTRLQRIADNASEEKPQTLSTSSSSEQPETSRSGRRM